MKNLNEMNKAELRAACKAVGVKGYGNMDNEAMRAAVAATQEPVVSEQDQALVAECGYANCPHCQVHLTNGFWEVDALVRDHLHNGNKAQAGQMNNDGTAKFWCMACDEFFGEVRVPMNLTPKAKAAPVSTGIKIEKVREEKNGIKRPSAGGVCRAIWDFCSAQPKAPTLKEVKAEAAVQGWDLVTTSVQYYQWRKFSGIVGRI
jgi:hypothetical protein